MTEPDETIAASPTAASPSRPDRLLTAFFIYFLLIAAAILLAILIAWNNGS